MSLICNRVNDQRIRDHIDILPDAEPPLEKYLLVGETQDSCRPMQKPSTPKGRPQPPLHALKYSKKEGKASGKSSGEPCTYCGFNHKFCQCSAKKAKSKIFQKIGHYTKVCRSKYKKKPKIMTGQIISLLDLQATRRKAPIFTWWQMMEKYWETTQRENISWLDIIDVYPDTQNNTSIYTKKGFLEVHNVHKTKSHQAFTKVEMFPRNWMGKSTGKKTTIMKCKLDTGASVNVMPLSTYQQYKPFRI